MFREEGFPFVLETGTGIREGVWLSVCSEIRRIYGYITNEGGQRRWNKVGYQVERVDVDVASDGVV